MCAKLFNKLLDLGVLCSHAFSAVILRALVTFVECLFISSSGGGRGAKGCLRSTPASLFLCSLESNASQGSEAETKEWLEGAEENDPN